MPNKECVLFDYGRHSRETFTQSQSDFMSAGGMNIHFKVKNVNWAIKT